MPDIGWDEPSTISLSSTPSALFSNARASVGSAATPSSAAVVASTVRREAMCFIGCVSCR
ncbi:Uncharacterised protein [Mycobacterium tuberculosis]|nr:Uncharacterised protein [Mycobacterium tuberculosis]